MKGHRDKYSKIRDEFRLHGNSVAREVCSVSERFLFDKTPMDTAAGEV